MSQHYQLRYASHPKDAKQYDTRRLREEFAITDFMKSGEINMVYSLYDRYIAGGAVPAHQSLTLETIDPLKADYFLERRELGIINVGAEGSVGRRDIMISRLSTYLTLLHSSAHNNWLPLQYLGVFQPYRQASLRTLLQV